MTTKKIEGKILKILKTITRFDELAKELTRNERTRKKELGSIHPKIRKTLLKISDTTKE